MRVSSERAPKLPTFPAHQPCIRALCASVGFLHHKRYVEPLLLCFPPYSPSFPSALPFEAIPLPLAHTRQRVVRSWARQSTVSAHPASTLPCLQNASFLLAFSLARISAACRRLTPTLATALRCAAWFWCDLHRLDVADILPRFMLTTRSQLPHLCHGLKFRRGIPPRHCCTYKFFPFWFFYPQCSGRRAVAWNPSTPAADLPDSNVTDQTCHSGFHSTT